MRNFWGDFAGGAVLVTLFLLYAGPLYALEIEWGAPGFANGKSVDSSLVPEAEDAPTIVAGPHLEESRLEKGFRGANWGMSKEQMEDEMQMEFVQCVPLPGERLNCAVKGVNMSIGNIPLILLRYKFFQDKFYGVSFKYAPRYEKDMYALYNEILGPPTGSREGFPIWHGQTYRAWATNTHFSFASETVRKTKRHGGGTF